MFKLFLGLTAVLLTLVLFPGSANAHLGGGPPFLRIDGKFALTNMYNQGATTLQIGWDVPPDTYLINKPITFEIDVPVLLNATTVPKDLENDVKVRWSFATGENFENKESSYEEGARIQKTFQKAGSFLVIIEAKLPADADFITVDTVQIDVLPNESYRLPSAYVYAGTQFDDPNKNILLVSESSADPSTKIKSHLWDFAEGTLHNRRSVNRRFEKTRTTGVERVIHRIVDENGFSSDIGFVVENRNNKLQFISFDPSGLLPVTVGTYQQAGERAGTGENKLSLPQFILVSIGTIVLIGGVWAWVLKKKKK